MCAAQHPTKDPGAPDTEDNLQVGRGLVKDFLVRCAPLVLHLIIHPLLSEHSSVSASDYGFEDDELYNNINGELDIKGADDNDDAKQNTSYTCECALLSPEGLRSSNDRGI